MTYLSLPHLLVTKCDYRLPQFTSLFSLALSPRILIVKGVTCSIISLPCTLSIDVDQTALGPFSKGERVLWLFASTRL